MAKKIKGISASTIVVLLLLGLVVTTTPADASITCDDALLKINSCGFYLLGKTDISPPCCEAAQDRHVICECFKKLFARGYVNITRAKQLPQLCSISLRVPSDNTTDCNTIN